MTNRAATIRTNLAWYEALLVLLAGVLGYLQTRSTSSGILCALGAGIAFGVWRCVRLLGHILEFTQLNAGSFDEDQD